jgi:hypothetical protein
LRLEASKMLRLFFNYFPIVSTGPDPVNLRRIISLIHIEIIKNIHRAKHNLRKQKILQMSDPAVTVL